MKNAIEMADRAHNGGTHGSGNDRCFQQWNIHIGQRAQLRSRLGSSSELREDRVDVPKPRGK
jgi:hypothetical protein